MTSYLSIFKNTYVVLMSEIAHISEPCYFPLIYPGYEMVSISQTYQMRNEVTYTLAGGDFSDEEILSAAMLYDTELQ
jgi:hypothetical protein